MYSSTHNILYLDTKVSLPVEAMQELDVVWTSKLDKERMSYFHFMRVMKQNDHENKKKNYYSMRMGA